MRFFLGTIEAKPFRVVAAFYPFQKKEVPAFISR